MFRVGDEVVCVDAEVARPSDTLIPGRPGSLPLLNGAIYTISGFGVWNGDETTPVVFLNEVQNDDYGTDVGFLPRRFRKVQRRDLKEWLSTSIKNTDHIDKRKRVKV